ncbi:T9SS type A sorting domain-containing protein [Changchengzhania lutea]|uniref:T9SS type A sorting domain-containing protein n=1 Tax=Changchengzhania lutea TaxID=2049305 RepID=UPI00163D7012|nr:T9SS type A sorting domain-containing protein [Changchengzhania lutea]
MLILVFTFFSLTISGSTRVNYSITVSNNISSSEDIISDYTLDAYNISEKLAPTYIQIQYPNGNEFWQVGKTPYITWESEGLESDIVLEYSNDNGISWFPIATVSNMTFSYAWTIPDNVSKNCLVRATSDIVTDTSNSVFEVSDDDSTCNIVVLGSSTAAGTGASPRDNSWANKFQYDIFQENTKLNIINLAKGGYSTYHILPNNTPIPDGRTIDEEKNITKALTYNPVAVIVNLPSNDTAYGYAVSTQLDNFEIVINEAEDNGVEAWVATTQPVNFSDANKIQMQIEVKDGINNLCGIKAIDFWTDLVDENGKLLPEVDYGDGIHVNNIGHDFLYKRVLGKNLQSQVCANPNVTLGINEIDELEDFNLKIFPNPTTNHVNLKFNSKIGGKLSISFYDVLGKNHLDMASKHSFSSGLNTLKLNWSNKNSNMYFVVFEFETQNGSLKKSMPLYIR